MTNGKDNFIYMRVYNDLRARVESGELAAGSRLPTEIELKDSYGVSRDTMRKALALLESAGYITRRVSAGTFVRAPKADYAPQSYHESFTEQMRKLGKTPSSEIHSIEMLAEVEPDIAARLELEEGERVYRLSRVRRADGEPMAYEIAYIRGRYCPDLQTRIYEDSSLYRIYEEDYRLEMDRIVIKLEAVNADARMQKLLRLKGSSALLKMTSVMHLKDGRPLYYVESYHIGDKYVFTTTMPRRL